MYAYLRVVAGPEQGRIFNLVEGTTLSIGRGEKTDTRLADGAVCRLHCELRCEGGEFHLADLESVSGTFVNGEKIQEHDLKHGEEIQVGNTRLKLYTSAMADTQKLVEAQKSAFHPAIRADAGVLTGQTISHYDLGPVLARGGMGTVYKARDTRAGKDIALKVLYPEFTHDEASLKRFMLVMKTVVGMHHHNLVGHCGAGKHGETCWYAMEYVEGEPLIKVIERLGTRKMINWRYTLSMGTQLARALEALHEKHIIHRNVTPESILIRSKDKVPKLGDLMLARVSDATESKTAPARANSPATWPTWPPSGPAPTRRSTSVPTSTAWGRRSTPSSPAGPPSRVRRWSRPSPRSGRTTPSRPSDIRTRSPTSSRMWWRRCWPNGRRCDIRPRGRSCGHWIGWRKPRPKPPTRASPPSSACPAIPEHPSGNPARVGMRGRDAAQVQCRARGS